MTKISACARGALVNAIQRIDATLKRSEQEAPYLAAPDGTVAVQIDDLRALLNDYHAMAQTIATGRQQWSARWYGSAPMKGSHIHTVTETGQYGRMIAYIGPDKEHHAVAGRLVEAHNAMLVTT